MTDEERQILVKDLREASDMQVTHWARVKAADEIERLAEENDRFRRALNNAWRQIEDDAANLDPERSVS